MKKVLVIDDEFKIRQMYTRFLRNEGIDVIDVPCAVDANEVLKRCVIDLVLLDIKMPDIDGNMMYDFISLFYKKVKIIVASVYPTEEQRQAISSAYDYYDKSQGIDMLLAKVKKALED
ncbi:MAG: response regulator [Candidatus Omnitrophota bacterium]